MWVASLLATQIIGAAGIASGETVHKSAIDATGLPEDVLKFAQLGTTAERAHPTDAVNESTQTLDQKGHRHLRKVDSSALTWCAKLQSPQRVSQKSS